MISRPTARIDERDVREIVNDLLRRRLGYAPEWLPGEKGADAAVTWITARYLYAILQRLNQAPEKNKLAFLDLLGLSLVAAQAARAPIVFQLSADAPDSQAPANTQVAAPPPPESSDQIVFETERATGVASAQLKEVFSLWPGRDQYINHSESLAAGQPFQLFKKPLLVDTPHAIFIAHDTLLALAGNVSIEVEFELTQTSGEPLSILWQYWDGKVWRGFKSVRPACSEKDFAQADSTSGFTRSGRFLLEADCAESAKQSVNGVEAYWIRGQLTETLPPDPTKALPLVESVRLTSVINQALKATLTHVINSNTPHLAGLSRLRGLVMNEAGQPLADKVVRITSPNDPNFVQKIVHTNPLPGTSANPAGEFDTDSTAPSLASQDNYDVEVSFLNLEATAKLRNLGEERNVDVDFTFNVLGLDPDKAFSEGTKLDVTKPFYPFGQQPQPGSVFYFNQEEILSKPGASVQIYVARTESPQDLFDIPNGTKTALEHLLAWEYWNGRRWATIFYSSSNPINTRDLNGKEIIEFTVPVDIEPTKVNEQEGLWMRVRIVSGGYGFTATVASTTGTVDNEFTFVISQPPVLSAFRMGYTWRHGPFHPEQVRTFNDFQYEDQTYASRWPGETFLPFKRLNDTTPALYLGFSKPLPVDRLGIFFDIVEQRGETLGPAMVWEYFDGSRWRDLSVDDETRSLRLPGIFSFIAAEDSRPLARFGQELHWLRGRLKEDGPPGEPVVNGIFPNAVWASEQRTLKEAQLGVSTGEPRQVFIFRQIPVLAGERIEVRELAGARAQVEWRITALEVSGQDPNIIRELEELLGREGPQIDILRGDLRLRRDRNKKVTEVWVRWTERPHLFGSAEQDRHYVIDRARGRVFFGDGDNGKIPPVGALIQSREHRVGGGSVGNLPARAIKQLLGGVAGVQAVFNPAPAEGGADGETVEAFSRRGPQTIRHRGRAIAQTDYETLAREASPAVAFARAIPTRNASGRLLPGWVTLLIIPNSEESRPWPSFGLRQHVLRYIERHAPATVAGAGQIFITGPEYLAVDVTARLAPRDPAEAGAVEKRARRAIEEFLHPLRGGPDHRGWEMGRDIYLSDVAAVLERVEGVDYVEEIQLSINGNLKGDRVRVADDRIVVAGEIRLKLEAAEA